MKIKVIIALGLAVLMTTLTACQADQTRIETSSTNGVSVSEGDLVPYEDCKYLCEGDWVRRDEKLKENLHITFTQEGDYTYRCDCGKHMDASDAFWLYQYDVHSKTIALSGRDGKIAEFGLLYADEDYLVLKCDDGTHVFKNSASEITDTVHECAAQYVPAGERALLTVLSYENTGIKVAPYCYDADAKASFKDRIYTLTTGDNVVFSSVNVTVDNDTPQVEACELDQEEYQYIGEYYTTGFLMFGADGSVDKIIFYGENWVDG